LGIDQKWVRNDSTKSELYIALKKHIGTTEGENPLDYKFSQSEQVPPHPPTTFTDTSNKSGKDAGDDQKLKNGKHKDQEGEIQT